MGKIEVDFQTLLTLSLLTEVQEHPNDDLELNKARALKRIPDTEMDILKTNIAWKMVEIMSYDKGLALRRTKRLMENFPKELIPNIEEWIDDKPISDIVVGELSIKMLMEQHKHEGIIEDFIDCAFVMKEYVNDGCNNPSDYFFRFNNL